MKQLMVACLVVLGLVRVAAAQAPGQVEPVTAVFLEKRVPEELAVEGVVLSRRNLGLQIEQLGDRWLTSLVDLSTGRVVASTKVDSLPADREAAVATMTHVVADLANQALSRGELPPPPPAPPPSVPGLIDDRAERAAREVAELKFRRRSIQVSTGNAGSRAWAVYQGDLNQLLAPVEFYNEVGRPDLASSYQARKVTAIGGLAVGAVVTIVGLGLTAAAAGTADSCSLDLPYTDFETCLHAHERDVDRQLQIASIVTLAGIGVGVVGFWYAARPHPISENDAKQLADGYNQRLRGELGLPVVSQRQRPPLIQQLALAPFTASGAAGLSLSGRF